MTLSSSLAVLPGQTSARVLWVSVEALSLDLGPGSSDWGGLGGPFQSVKWKLQVRGHPVPPGSSKLKLHKNELMCAQLDRAEISGDSGCIHASHADNNARSCSKELPALVNAEGWQLHDNNKLRWW